MTEKPMMMKLPATRDELDKIQKFVTPARRLQILLAEADRVANAPDETTVLGYIKLDRPGDLDVGDDCPVCGETNQGFWWIQVCSTGEMHIMCGSCATSE